MLKKLVQQLVPKTHWEFLSWYRTRFGAGAAVSAYLRMVLTGIGRAPNALTGKDVFVRPGTTDQDVYDEIFVAKEYDINLGTPKFIVDAGAHIGLSTVFFASKYPQATVIAIEPEPSNFALLQKNTQSYANVKAVQAGLWNRKTHLKIENSDVATWSFRVIENDSGEGIAALSVQDIMSMFSVSKIDVLKIDIEGSEVEVMSNSQGWIDQVGTLVIELHDRFKPGCTDALERSISAFTFERSISGESVVIGNLRRAA